MPNATGRGAAVTLRRDGARPGFAACEGAWLSGWSTRGQVRTLGQTRNVLVRRPSMHQTPSMHRRGA